MIQSRASLASCRYHHKESSSSPSSSTACKAVTWYTFHWNTISHYTHKTPLSMKCSDSIYIYTFNRLSTLQRFWFILSFKESTLIKVKKNIRITKSLFWNVCSYLYMNRLFIWLYKFITGFTIHFYCSRNYSVHLWDSECVS